MARARRGWGRCRAQRTSLISSSETTPRLRPLGETLRASARRKRGARLALHVALPRRTRLRSSRESLGVGGAMATALKEMVGKQISVITCDGRNIVGQLRGYDQVRALRPVASRRSLRLAYRRRRAWRLGVSTTRAAAPAGHQRDPRRVPRARLLPRRRRRAGRARPLHHSRRVLRVPGPRGSSAGFAPARAQATTSPSSASSTSSSTRRRTSRSCARTR